MARKRITLFQDRKVGTRLVKDRFLICCEGEKTEPNYFRCFRVPKDVVELDIRGLGYNTDSLMEETIRIKSESDYDQVWCVLDRDSFTKAKFNKALQLAEQNNIKIAYSNESFELWYLLHFNYHDTGISRRDYITKLGQYLNHKYEKSSKTIYKELIDKQPDALRNAKKLLESYPENNPEKNNPSTLVHCLVEELNKFITN